MNSDVNKQKLLSVFEDINKQFNNYLLQKAKENPEALIKSISNEKITSNSKDRILNKSLNVFSKNSYVFLKKELENIKISFLKETFILLNFYHMNILLNKIKDMTIFNKQDFLDLLSNYDLEYQKILEQNNEYVQQIEKNNTFQTTIEKFISDIEQIIKVKSEKDEEEHLKKIYELIYNNMLSNKKQSFQRFEELFSKAEYRKDFEKFRSSIENRKKIKDENTTKMLISIDKLKKSNTIIFNNLKK